jgi:hypothetical protein
MAIVTPAAAMTNRRIRWLGGSGGCDCMAPVRFRSSPTRAEAPIAALFARPWDFSSCPRPS